MSNTTIGYVVDVQRDFMNPDGRLYVQNPEDEDDPGAQACRDEIVKTVEYFRENMDGIIFSGDWHDFEDDEIDTENPDFEETYPPHCMGRSSDEELARGAHLIEEIGSHEDMFSLGVRDPKTEAVRAADHIVDDGGEVFVQKTRFNVFNGNPVMGTFVDELNNLLDEPEFVVCGVARDVCVDQAVFGLTAKGFPVTVVQDATWGLGLEPEEETLSNWKKFGMDLITTDKLT